MKKHIENMAEDILQEYTNCYSEVDQEHLEKMLYKLALVVKANTVREMQTEIINRCVKGGIYPAFVATTIDKIAKEMIENG